MTTFVTTSLDTDHLVDLATWCANDYGIPSADWQSLLACLAPLRAHNPETYAHSMRVGLYAGGLGAFEGHNASYTLGGGCVHDLGKLTISNDVLRADPFTDTDFAIIQAHPVTGFNMLHDDHPLLALVAGLHHQFQKRAYGIGLDHPAFTDLSEVARAQVVECIGIVATCDFYDAATTRNDAFAHAPDDVRQNMAANGWPASRIDWLFSNDLSASASGKGSLALEVR